MQVNANNIITNWVKIEKEKFNLRKRKPFFFYLRAREPYR